MCFWARIQMNPVLRIYRQENWQPCSKVPVVFLWKCFQNFQFFFLVLICCVIGNSVCNGSVNKPYTLAGPTVKRLVQDPLAVLHLENRLYIPAQFSTAQLGESKVMKDNLKVKVDNFLILFHSLIFFLLFSYFMTRQTIPNRHVCFISHFTNTNLWWINVCQPSSWEAYKLKDVLRTLELLF